MTRMTRRRAALGLALSIILAGLVARLGTPGPPAVRTITVGRIPLALAVDARTRRVFVANYGSATVSMLDAASGAVLATVAVAPQPSALAVATTAGRVFAVSDDVTLDGAGRVSVLDARSGRLLRTVAVGRGAHLLAVHARSAHVFVTNAMDASVSVLDARSGRVLRTFPLGRTPTAMAVDERTDRVFLLTLMPGFHGQGMLSPTVVSLLDARSGTLLRTVRMGTAAIALGLSTDGIAVDEHSGQAFISNSHDNTVQVLDGRIASVVRTLVTEVTPGALAVDERSGHVFVANEYDHSVSMVAAASGRVLRTVALGLAPRGIAVDQRADRVFVSAGAEFWPSPSQGRVLVLDGRTGRLLRTVSVGLGPAALAVDERSGHVFVANIYGTAADPDSLGRMLVWSRPWLPAWGQLWLARLAPPAAATRSAAGSVSVLDVTRS